MANAWESAPVISSGSAWQSAPVVGGADTLAHEPIRHPLDTSGLTPLQSAFETSPVYAPMRVARDIGKSIGNAAMHPDDTMRTLANGMSFGFADKLAAADPLGINQSPVPNQTPLEAQRLQSTQAKERLGPVAGPAIEIAGSMLPASRLMQAGATATRLPMIGKALGLSLDGAGYGALDAAGHDNNIAQGAALGAASGAIGQGIGTLASKFMSKIPTQMTGDQLTQAAKNAYDKADSLGIVYKPQAISNLSNNIKSDFADFGYHPELHPGAKVALGELDRLAANGNVNLKGLEAARRIASNSYIPMNKSNNTLVGKVIKKIDDFATTASSSDVIMGNSADAADSLKNARALWQRKSKLDLIDSLISKAETRAGSTGAGGNIENATRQNLRKILDSEAKSRGFTADEKAALNSAVVGTPTQNILRQVGKFSPVGNGLIATLEALTALGGHAAGVGPAAPLVIGGAALGTGSKFASEAMQRKAVSKLQSLIASGGNANSVKPVLAKATDKQIKQLVRTLMIGGATALGSQ